jgi:hypothetical protein
MAQFTLPQDTARSVVRKLRGGARAHLLRCDHGDYVVKFANNPQGRRTLINELIAGRLLQCLGIDMPAIALIRVDDDVLRRHGGLSIAEHRLEPPADEHGYSMCSQKTFCPRS